ncbi:hypothetical protein [Paenibacillus humicola]|uniref:hypothetical protein n=1 Tax=Paenibacillus humicola TaxID=3110540 RepID=UPI00237B58C3|nr:hypothetical protein [Paenibacillus humicola]
MLKAVAVILCTFLLMAGCSSNNSSATKGPNPRIVDNMNAAGAGPVTKDNTSIGGTHIGDTQEQVKNLLGKPVKIINGGGGTPNIRWFYDHDHTIISFYRNGETGPVGGVVDILLNQGSRLKTDKNIGIGSSDKDILAAYPSIAQSHKMTDDVVNYWLTGTKRDEGFYHPSITFIVKEGKVTTITLSNSLIDPNK